MLSRSPTTVNLRSGMGTSSDDQLSVSPGGHSDGQRMNKEMTLRDLIQGLNQIAICVDGFEAMRSFDREVIGLRELGSFPDAVYRRTVDGVDGTIQRFGIFDCGARSDANPASRRLVHIPFGVRLDDHKVVTNHLQAAGVEPDQLVHSWKQMRSIYVNDP